MIDKRPHADRLLIAEIYGEARHRAQWRDLSSDEETAAVAELRTLAGGRADLLAEVTGILEGTSEGELDEPLCRQAATLCRKAGAGAEAIPGWIAEGRRRRAAASMPPPSGGVRGPRLASYAGPPRSRVAAITGAANGVETTAASAFSQRTVRLLPWIFVCPNPAPSLACPYTRFCIESMSMNASTSAPGSSGAADASSRRATASSWRTLPQVNDPQRGRRPDPAEHLCHGAVPQDVHVIDAVRPGGDTRDQAGDLQARVIVTCSPARSARPHLCAMAMTGTRAARDTRFGSSYDACVFAGSCDNRTCEVSSRSGSWQLQLLPSSQLRGHLSHRRAQANPYLRGGSRLRSRDLAGLCRTG